MHWRPSLTRPSFLVQCRHHARTLRRRIVRLSWLGAFGQLVLAALLYLLWILLFSAA